MAHLSPSAAAINAIAHCLANALDASTGLDARMSEDLRAMLRIAAGEVDRVRKANRKAATAAKRASGEPEKKSRKRARAEETEAQRKPAKSKGRVRKAEAANSVIASH